MASKRASNQLERRRHDMLHRSWADNRAQLNRIMFTWVASVVLSVSSSAVFLAVSQRNPTAVQLSIPLTNGWISLIIVIIIQLTPVSDLSPARHTLLSIPFSLLLMVTSTVAEVLLLSVTMSLLWAESGFPCWCRNSFVLIRFLLSFSRLHSPWWWHRAVLLSMSCYDKLVGGRAMQLRR